MKPFRTLSALLAPTLLLLPLAGQAAPPAPAKPAPGITGKVSAPATRVKAGGAAALSVSLVNLGPAVPKGVVDLEVYDAKGKRVGQHTWEGQTLAKGKSAVYQWAWKPTAGGAYTVKLGVFGSTWKPLYYWADKALALTVA